MESLKEHILKYFEQEIKREVMQLSFQSFASKFHASKLSDLKSFSYEDQEKELVKNCPVFCSMVTVAATNKKKCEKE